MIELLGFSIFSLWNINREFNISESLSNAFLEIGEILVWFCIEWSLYPKFLENGLTLQASDRSYLTTPLISEPSPFLKFPPPFWNFACPPVNYNFEISKKELLRHTTDAVPKLTLLNRDINQEIDILAQILYQCKCGYQ